jgi:SNF2 family DNA or RNA helicase
MAKDTIEEVLLRVIWKKQSVVSGVLDGGETDNPFDVFQEALLAYQKQTEIDI